MIRRLLLTAVLFGSTSPGVYGQDSLFDEARFVEVGGHPVRVLSLGLDARVAGQPVLVMQAGAGSAIETWGSSWLRSLAEVSPVVAYDRPGLGQSEMDGVLPTLSVVTEHLRSLLRTLGVEPPFILVGHSWGGPLNLFFSGRYSSEVVGMVYLETSVLGIFAAGDVRAGSTKQVAGCCSGPTRWLSS